MPHPQFHSVAGKLNCSKGRTSNSHFERIPPYGGTTNSELQEESVCSAPVRAFLFMGLCKMIIAEAEPVRLKCRKLPHAVVLQAPQIYALC